MQRLDSWEFINRLEDVIRIYGLSDVKTKGYKYYGCSSSDGLSAYNREPYMKLRQEVNQAEVQDDDYYIKLYTLIIYAFNNQIRFNQKGGFNLPPGKRDFNQNMYDKLSAFLNLLHTQKAVFTNRNFKDMDLGRLTPGDFVYADPPILLPVPPIMRTEAGGKRTKGACWNCWMLYPNGISGLRYQMSSNPKGEETKYWKHG